MTEQKVFILEKHGNVTNLNELNALLADKWRVAGNITPSTSVAMSNEGNYGTKMSVMNAVILLEREK